MNTLFFFFDFLFPDDRPTPTGIADSGAASGVPFPGAFGAGSGTAAGTRVGGGVSAVFLGMFFIFFVAGELLLFYGE